MLHDKLEVLESHHIVPDYRCKELGITTSYKVDGIEFYFKENYLHKIPKKDHALIHWGYYCDNLEPLFKYVTPPQWVIDLIPIRDGRDGSAGSLIGLGEIDGIVPLSGENHPMYKHGKAVGVRTSPKIKASYDKQYRENPNTKPIRAAVQKRHDDKNKVKKSIYDKERNQLPEFKAREKIRSKVRRAKNKAETGYTHGFSRAKKKIEKRGEGTLKAFI